MKKEEPDIVFVTSKQQKIVISVDKKNNKAKIKIYGDYVHLKNIRIKYEMGFLKVEPLSD